MPDEAFRHMWHLSEAGDDNLGLACTDSGLLLGRTALIERRDDSYVVRDQREIEQLLSRAYQTDITADCLMSGLASVASALNANDQCLARIAAVHLRIPDIPDRTARDAMEAEDILVKSGNWNPALHPRTGTPPNPGWFAPTDDSARESFPVRIAQNDDPTRRSDASPATHDDWVRLRPGPKRIDELADFIEWIANARPEDAPAIRAEIDRYFENVGWEAAAKDLKNMVAVLIRPGITNEDRRKFLNRLDVYTRVDPEEYLRIFGFTSSFALAGAGVPPAAHGTSAAEGAAREAGTAAEARAAEAGAADAPSEVWTYGWARRGIEIDRRFRKGTLPPLFRTIDDFENGVATSIKSIDLNAVTYQASARLAYRINQYVDKLSDYDGGRLLNKTIQPGATKERVLNLIVPKNAMTEEQRIAIEAARARAKMKGSPVDVIVTEY